MQKSKDVTIISDIFVSEGSERQNTSLTLKT